MGELEGVKNAWGYPEGGNGAVSMAIARAAQSHGAVVATDSVSELLSSRTRNDKRVIINIMTELYLLFLE